MMAVSRKAGLLLGWMCMASPALAQGVAILPQSPTIRSAPPGIEPVEPKTTAAMPVAVPAPAPPVPRKPAGPAYQPDGGGPLSGLPFDRHAPVPPPAPPVRTLAEAITLAYRTNPDLLSARAVARSVDFRVPQARSQFGPSLSATGAYTLYAHPQRAGARDVRGSPGLDQRAASLILNQPVFTFGRNAAAEAGARATSQYQRDVLRLTEAQVLGDVVTTYASVLRDAQAVTIARENLALLERQLSDNQKRYEVRD